MIYVIDDDPSVRAALEDLFASVGMDARTFASTQEFLDNERTDEPQCLVLDVRMPGKNGLEFQRELAESGIRLPIIFITAHGDIPMSVRAMKAGAIEFLTKPFLDQELLDAIARGLEKDAAERQDEASVAELRQRLDTLTAREREVLGHVIRGRLNKQIAGDLDLSEITVKVHRGQVMRKMQARSLIDLVRMTDRLGIPGNA